MSARATDEERRAVDSVVGEPQGTGLDGRVALGGFHAAAASRHLLLPALHGVQDAIGWISRGALNYICERLQVPPADAYGVATFYALLSTTPQPPVVVHACTDIACMPGSDAIVDGLEAAVGHGEHAGWKPSPCLGACAQAPAVFVQQAGGASLQCGPVPGNQDWSVLPEASAPVPVPQPASQRRIAARLGVVDPTSLASYRDHGGYLALTRAIAMGFDTVIDELDASGLRGRGGAAFPAGAKWRSVAAAAPGPKYLVCNADESEPGTFKDRALLEGDPFAVVEAMTIAGLACGATTGYAYVRGEYPTAAQRLAHAIDEARRAGLLGSDAAGSGAAFDVEIRMGAGAYICGEETALFNSIEGFRGEPRQKPPYPTESGLFGRPTLVNNVETLVNVLDIVTNGAAQFAARGTTGSTGTRLFCLSGAVARPGVYETDLGTTLGELLDLAGGVTGDLAAVLLGGAAGSFVGPDMLDLRLTFEDARAAGVSLGSGVVMPFTTETDFTAVTRRIAAFFRDESCGQCVPCRVGTVRQEEQLASTNGSLDAGLIDEIDRVMRDASICGLGHTAGSAVRSAIELGLIGPAR